MKMVRGKLLVLGLLVALGLTTAWLMSEQAVDPAVQANSQTTQLEQPEPQAAQTQREHLVILHINDSHGRLAPHKLKGRSVGGIARLAGLVNQIRGKNPGRVLLLHGGDEFSSGDAVTKHYKGQANIDLMNHMGYDAMVLGNGEYYQGLENLRQRMAQAKFTVLAGNIFELTQEGQKAVGQNFVIKKVGPLRVGLMGLSLIRPQHRTSQNLRAGENLKLANKWGDELKTKTDLMVLLSHQGLPADTMLAGTINGVDIIVGGHTHTLLKEPVIVKKGKGDTQKKVYIVQAGKYYEHLGRIDLDFSREDDRDWKLTKVRSQLIPINESVEEDAKIADRLKEYRRKLSQGQPAAVGVSP